MLKIVIPTEILSWKSARKDQISLPYGDDSLILQEVWKAIADHLVKDYPNAESDTDCTDEYLKACCNAKDTAVISVFLDLIVSNTCPHIGFSARITLLNGYRLEAKCIITGNIVETVDLISSFFENGGQGLNSDVKTQLLQEHVAFCRSFSAMSKIS